MYICNFIKLNIKLFFIFRAFCNKDLNNKKTYINIVNSLKNKYHNKHCICQIINKPWYIILLYPLQIEIIRKTQYIILRLPAEQLYE